MKKRDFIFAVLGTLLLLLMVFIEMQRRRAAPVLCAQNIGAICTFAGVEANENGGRMPANFSSNWVPLRRLICPCDRIHRPAPNWASFTVSNTSYVILEPGISGPEIDDKPYLTCIIHTNYFGNIGGMRGFDPNAQ